MAVIALGAGRCWKDRADEDPDPPRLVTALLPATVLGALAIALFGPGQDVPAAGALTVAAAAAVIVRSYQSSLELRRLTEDTRRHERRFRAIFEHAHEAILLADDDRRYLAANPAACELLGRDEDEIVGRRIEDVSEAPREVVIQMWEDFKIRGADAMEYSLLRRDGARRFVHYSAVAGIEPGVHLAVLRDITARHEAEKRLRRSEAQLQAAQRLSHVGSWEMFADATTARWSREMCRIHGIEPTDEDLPRDLALSFWHPGDRDMLERLWVEFEAGVDLEEEDEFRYRIIRPDGEERVIAATCTRETDVDGREILRGTCMDVTERVQASEQAERLRAELDSARRLDALGRLAGGVAHDFNNLLSVIIARAHFASRALGDHPAAADVTEILGTADRAAKLVSQLMLFGGADRGEAEPVTLGALLGELQPLLQRLAGPGARLHLDVPEHEGLAVRADRTKLEQVAVNLITNARDAVGEDGDIHVSVRELPGWQVELRVRDDGVGMPPEVVAAIFEPFFTTKRSAGGTGLGLSVVYGIVTDAGGTITVDSRPGEGTTFHVVLPAERHVEQVALEEPGERAGGAAVARAPREETVLVVDDEDGVLEVAARALTDAGWRVIKANDGNTALREAARERVDVLLSDVVMPGRSGVQLARELRHRIPGLPVILMTGHASGSEDLRVGDAQVTKPFTPGDLVAAMDEVLEVSR